MQKASREAGLLHQELDAGSLATHVPVHQFLVRVIVQPGKSPSKK